MHNEIATWLKQQQEQYKHIESQKWTDNNITETTAAICKTINTKPSLIDRIANLGIKNISSALKGVAREYNDIMINQEKCTK